MCPLGAARQDGCVGDQSFQVPWVMSFPRLGDLWFPLCTWRLVALGLLELGPEGVRGTHGCQAQLLRMADPRHGGSSQALGSTFGDTWVPHCTHTVIMGCSWGCTPEGGRTLARERLSAMHLHNQAAHAVASQLGYKLFRGLRRYRNRSKNGRVTPYTTITPVPA